MIFRTLILDPSDLIGWSVARGAQLHLLSPTTDPRMTSRHVADCASRIAPPLTQTSVLHGPNPVGRQHILIDVPFEIDDFPDKIFCVGPFPP